MTETLYPKFLVFMQFVLIGLMVYFSHGVLGSVPALLVFMPGLAMGFWALDHNKRGNFNIQPKLREGCRLVTTGAYKYIRHPMYTSVITMMFAVFVSTPTLLELLLFMALILVLVLKAQKEEQLWCGHDADYIAYKKSTKLFIPYIL